MRGLVGLVLLLAAGPLAGQLPTRLSPAELSALSARLSEPGGFFDTDNLVSNEDSYLHAISHLQRLGVQGGVYLGVGPDQNFSYIAQIRPRVAFIVDIRRDNLLELLLYRALFQEAQTRVEFLCLLFGRRLPAQEPSGLPGDGIDSLISYVEAAPPQPRPAQARVEEALRRSGVALSDSDVATIRRFHSVFIEAGPALRLTTFNRAERTDYPTYGQLLRQRDLDGRQVSYLASEERFQAVRDLQVRNLIVPVVGDFGGPRALRAIGAWVAQHGERVSAFYTSNVEQYLFQDGKMPEFARSVAALPSGPSSVMIRSYFPYARGHDDLKAGYLAVQLVQPIGQFLQDFRAGRYQSYRDLVTARIR